MDHATYVDAHYPVPVFLAVLPHQTASKYAGIVEQHVHGTELCQCCVGQRLDLLGLGDVGTQTDHRSSACAQFGDGGL
ncbi:hypothetical protein D3C77_586930 [compost metagenome]